MTLTIGVDVGGTKIAGGVVEPDGTIVATARRDTPAHETQATEEAIASVVHELRADRDIEAVGIGAAGYIDADRSIVLFAPNLAWRDEPLREVIEDAVGLRVVVENDANAAAWGEFRFGAGADVDDLLMVALGTGIGGGIVLDGALFRGGFGIAGEFGHVTMVPEGRLCGCGNLGCWEQYASGPALIRVVRDAAVDRPASASGILDAAGGDPAAITGQLVTEAARAGDRLCIEAFETVGDWLGRGLADLASIFDPQVVVVGGGVSEAGGLLVDPAQESFRRHLTGRGHRPEMEIRLAALGNSAGLIGASDLARQP